MLAVLLMFTIARCDSGTFSDSVSQGDALERTNDLLSPPGGQSYCASIDAECDVDRNGRNDLIVTWDQPGAISVVVDADLGKVHNLSFGQDGPARLISAHGATSHVGKTHSVLVCTTSKKGSGPGNEIEVRSYPQFIKERVYRQPAEFSSVDYGHSSAILRNIDAFDHLAIGSPSLRYSPGGVVIPDAQLVCGIVEVTTLSEPAVTQVLKGLVPGDGFGSALAAIADINADGYADLLVGAPDGNSSDYRGGYVTLVSGKDASVIRRLNRTDLGLRRESRIGSAVLSVGDIDGDALSDFAVTAAGALDLGAVVIVSGKSAKPLFTLRAPKSSEDTLETFGSALALTYSITPQRIPLLVIGHPSRPVSSASGGEGAVYLYSMVDGSMRTELLSVDLDCQLGSVLSSLPPRDNREGVVFVSCGHHVMSYRAHLSTVGAKSTK